MNSTKLEWEDICHHTPRCEYTEWLYFTVPNYRTYHRASHWLREVRNQKAVFVNDVRDENGNHTGKYKFRFLCKHEFVLFALTWS